MVDKMTILYSVLILFALALIAGFLLAVFGTKLAVKKDEKLSSVESKLAGANCGACGYAGCAAFAKALVDGNASISDCTVTGKEAKDEIAQILGVTSSGEETMVVVRCIGGNDAVDKYEYMGYGDCRSMELLAGGRKQCNWGCLGMGSCTDACFIHAIEVGNGGYAKIEQEKCVGCGKCISVCPKKLIGRIPKSAKVYIACSNHDKGKDVRAVCKKGCIACGICVKNCPQGAIELKDNLPVIDYKKCTGCKICAVKCPAKCILVCDNSVDKV